MRCLWCGRTITIRPLLGDGVRFDIFLLLIFDINDAARCPKAEGNGTLGKTIMTSFLMLEAVCTT